MYYVKIVSLLQSYTACSMVYYVLLCSIINISTKLCIYIYIYTHVYIYIYIYICICTDVCFIYLLFLVLLCVVALLSYTVSKHKSEQAILLAVASLFMLVPPILAWFRAWD